VSIHVDPIQVAVPIHPIQQLVDVDAVEEGVRVDLFQHLVPIHVLQDGVHVHRFHDGRGHVLANRRSDSTHGGWRSEWLFVPMMVVLPPLLLLLLLLLLPFHCRCFFPLVGARTDGNGGCRGFGVRLLRVS